LECPKRYIRVSKKPPTCSSVLVRTGQLTSKIHISQTTWDKIIKIDVKVLYNFLNIKFLRKNI